MLKHICIHGHFYQPPRENPWLESIETQESASPYLNWNERITAECYAPNAASRILDQHRKIIEIVNNYSQISFNFGPTLLSWLETFQPETYREILQADQESIQNFSGHGSAMAQVYNHMIMPLANPRDKKTQVIWGLQDFEYRFKRKAVGMWLPETAVDLETLEVLVDYGIQFTLLAPRQARRVKALNENRWRDVISGQVDPRVAYRCDLPSGRTIVIFFYDGVVSQEVAFGGLLSNGENFANRLLSTVTDHSNHPVLCHIATDGETYGHHHSFGDMALAYCLNFLKNKPDIKLTNYAQFLSQHPPTMQVEIIENTSWSCIHGIERWRSNCGCRMDTHLNSTQEWRTHLRQSLDWLRDQVEVLFEKEMSSMGADPWELRNRYIKVLLNKDDRFLKKIFTELKIEHDELKQIKVLKLLELQRHAMLMFTSCGWFFDDLSGIEAVQVLQYAARVIQLAQELGGVSLEESFVERLSKAPCNHLELKNGAMVYLKLVKPLVVSLQRVSAHVGVCLLFENDLTMKQIYCYRTELKQLKRYDSARRKMIIGEIDIESLVTHEKKTFALAAIWLGNDTVQGYVQDQFDRVKFESFREDFVKIFSKGEEAIIKKNLQSFFSSKVYSLWDLFKNEQERILNQILDPTLKEIEVIFRQVYKHHHALMSAPTHSRISLPKALATTVEFVLNRDLKQWFTSQRLDLPRLKVLSEEVGRWSFGIDPILGFNASQKVTSLMHMLFELPEDLVLLASINDFIEILASLPLKLDLWRAQNIYYFIDKKFSQQWQQEAKDGNKDAKQRIKFFEQLGQKLQL